jgi:hypothetical protein
VHDGTHFILQPKTLASDRVIVRFCYPVNRNDWG